MAQAGEGRPGGVWQPAGGGDQLVQRGALVSREQAGYQRLLGHGSEQPDAGDFREEPGAGKPPARICEGEAEWPSYSTANEVPT